MLWDEPKIFFLERRYFFSIILSEFLKNRVALQFDATQRNITYMKNGTVQFLIDQSPYQQGYKAVKLLVDYLFEGRAPDVSCYYLDAHIKNAFNC